MSYKQVLQKGEKVGDLYKVQFHLESNVVCQKYRVQDTNGKIFLLITYKSARLTATSLKDGQLSVSKLFAGMSSIYLPKFVTEGELVRDTSKYQFVVYQFPSGESLSKKIEREGGLNQYNAIVIISEILKGIKFLHSQEPPVIHNNLTLDSVYLDYSQNIEQPLFLEFIQTRLFVENGQQINKKLLSPYFSAPELLNGIYTPQSDIFAVGAILYNLIFGTQPWYNGTIKESDPKFFQKLEEAREKPLLTNVPMLEDLDRSISLCLQKALAIDVDERFESVDEFIKQIKRKSKVAPQLDQKTPSRKKRGKGFADIAGMQDLKDTLNQDVIKAINEKERYEKYGLSIPNGMLLYGPPGCGKTFISEKLAEEVGYNFYSLTPADLKSKYINETEEKISKIFKEAIEQAPSIVFIDEIDAIAPDRNSDLHQMHAGAVNELLAQTSNLGDKDVFFIAATNIPEKIDPAILRRGRIDKKIFVAPPDQVAREEMFRLYLKGRPIEIDIDFKKLGELTNHFVSSDIKYLVDESARISLAREARISSEIVINVIKKSKPSLTKTQLQKYMEIKTKWENEDDSETRRNEIGFKF